MGLIYITNTHVFVTRKLIISGKKGLSFFASNGSYGKCLLPVSLALSTTSTYMYS